MKAQPENTCLILLLGGRIQPAATTVLQLRPTLVGFVASKDTPQRVTQIQELIARALPNTTMLTPKYVPAYEPPATRRALAELLEEASTISTTVAPMISLTGAPQPMSMAGYEVARQLGCPAYYVTEAGQLRDLAADTVTTIDLQLNVEAYLNLYGVRLNGSPEFAGDALNIAHADALAVLIAEPRVTGELIIWMSKLNQLAPPKRQTRQWTLREPHWQLLCQLTQLGIVCDLERQSTRKGDQVTLGITSGAAVRFLEGKWLESYLFQQAQLAKRDTAPLFDSGLGGVKLLSEDAEREIDFIGTYRNKALIATCKTGRESWKKAALDEVVAVARLFGDDYCIKLFVTSQAVPSAGSNQAPAHAHFLAHAKQAQVVVVTGEQLPALQAILSRELAKPTYIGK